MVARTSAGSRTGANSATVAAPWKSVVSSAATARASRVLPTPPGPVTVSSRVRPVRSRSNISDSCASRPIIGVGGTGTPAADEGWTDGGRRAADTSADRSTSSSRNASASERTVCGYGYRRSPRSRAPTALTVSPARTASSS